MTYSPGGEKLSQNLLTPHSLSRVNQKRTGDDMSIRETIDEMKHQEEIIQQLDPHAVELWRQGQEILENYPVQIKEPTAALAKWFLKNHLQQIKTPAELEKAYYSHSFSNPLFEKWKQSKNRSSYQTAEDVAFQWRLQELMKISPRIKLDSPEAFQEAMNRKLPLQCPYTKHYCEHWKVIETQADGTWTDGCVANPKVHSIPKFCKRTNWDLINVVVNTEREKKFRDLYKRLVEKSKLWIYSGVYVRTDFHAWLIRNHLI